MKLQVKRIAKKPLYTIGKLYINGVYFCDTIEDTDRNLSSNMAEFQIKSIKVKDKTAIPTGTYKITMDVVSPRYSKVAFYKTNANGGRVPRLLNVKGFDGVLIHCGNTQEDSSGCIIIGKNKQVGKVLNSKETFIPFYKKLQEAYKKREDITIEVI